MTGLTIGSLFAGIGGLELGLEWAGHGPVLWQVERDPYCKRVLAKHWPDAERFDDVCTVGAAELAAVDIVCGGFPCQDLSYAGKGAGLEGARSGLWFEFARIIRELRPRFVVVENVAALLARGLGVVLGDLAASGYDATWDCIPAAAVGAPHQRDRVFALAYAASFRLCCSGNDDLQQQESSSKAAKEIGLSRPLATVPKDVWRAARRSASTARWQTEPDVGRVAKGSQSGTPT